MTDNPVEKDTLAYPFERPNALEPCPHYKRLRETGPLADIRMPSGDHALLVTDYDAVRTVLSDARFSRAATARPGAPRIGTEPQNAKNLLSMDPPEHTRVRRLVSREFTARRVAALRPRIQGCTDELLDAMERTGAPTDLVPALAFPLPVTVICELLGVPLDEREQIAEWSGTVLSTVSLPVERIVAAHTGLATYLGGLIAAKQREPGDDLLSALVSIHEADAERLDEEELLHLAITLLIAGHETTTNQIGNSVLALLTHPEQFEAVRRDPGTVPAAVEELLRFVPPGDEATLRIATEDVKLSDTLVPAGTAVLASLASANRDAAQFTDADTLDVARTPGAQHLTFGYGIHYCLGAGLARLELEIALESLLRRFPSLRLAVPAEEVPRSSGRLIHGVTSLPVAW
ncbi:cytochrome P450 [Streptomyces sp. SP2-10]|uniref:cytochrome P450 n=1 Tax=Streptomyces sp. SP2-10 TaxID=2873385 RepID=UPI001CA68FBD|nr:cytochrome P450 [Streptomyces sp. SP2-10]MBY8843599.1 cytochrome P450 [Streptomyces sp. SP2-10]